MFNKSISNSYGSWAVAIKFCIVMVTEVTSQKIDAYFIYQVYFI